MKGWTGVLTLWLICAGCDQLIGIRDTELVIGTSGGSATMGRASDGGGSSGRINEIGSGPSASATSGGALASVGGSAAGSSVESPAGASSGGVQTTPVSYSGQSPVWRDGFSGAAGSAAGEPAQVGGGGGNEFASSGGAGGDGGGRAVGGETPAPFSPLDLPGLALWLDGSSGIESMQTGAGQWITEWRDRSPHHNDARQPDLGKAPRLSARGANGEPGITFDGDTQCLQIEDNPSLDLGTHDLILEVVGHFTNSVLVSNSQWGYGMFLCKPTPPYPFTGPCMFTNNPPSWQDATVSDPGLAAQLSAEVWLETGNVNLNDGIVRSYALVRSNGDKLSLRVNGRELAAVAIASDMDESSPDSPLWIGGTGVPAQALRGLIGEIILIDGYSSANLEQLETYLNAKYHLWPR